MTAISLVDSLIMCSYKYYFSYKLNFKSKLLMRTEQLLNVLYSSISHHAVYYVFMTYFIMDAPPLFPCLPTPLPWEATDHFSVLCMYELSVACLEST